MFKKMVPILICIGILTACADEPYGTVSGKIESVAVDTNRYFNETTLDNGVTYLINRKVARGLSEGVIVELSYDKELYVIDYVIKEKETQE